MSDKPWAEELPYWQTSKSSAESWREKAEAEILRAGGYIMSSGEISQEGQTAIFVGFWMTGDNYRVVFPALKSRKGNVKAAKVQAATMLYHDIKARCVSMRVQGAKVAFGGYRILPDGRTDGQVSSPELAAALPKMLTGGG